MEEIRPLWEVLMERLDLTPFLECETLPTLPDQISRVLDETGRASAMDYNIVQIIQFDPAIASRVLQVANSTLYGYPSQIGSLQQAAGLLGPGVIKSIILTTPIFERFEGEDAIHRAGIDYYRLWRNSAAVGAVAGALGGQFEGFESDVCFTSGLLHDLGKISLAVLKPEAFQECYEQSKKQGRSMLEVEQEILGITHVEIQLAMAANWGFPEALKSRRHQNKNGGSGVPELVELAKGLTEQWGFDDDLGLELEDTEYMSSLCSALGYSLQDVKARESELKNYANQVTAQI